MGLRYQIPVTQPAMPQGFAQMRRVHHSRDVYAQFARIRREVEAPKSTQENKLSRPTLVLSTVAVAVMVSTLGFLFLSHHSPLPSVQGAPELYASTLASGGKSEFLSSVSISKQRDLAGKVHFVTDIIRSVQPNAKKAKALARAIVLESRAAGVDPFFVAAVIKSESTFMRNARSHKGAVGLMQLLPSTAKYISRKRNIDWMGASTLTEARYNVRLGIAYLKYLEEMYNGNRKLALVAYNWGPGKVLQSRKRGGTPPRSTLRYANTILSDHANWKGNYLDRYTQYRFLNVSYLGS